MCVILQVRRCVKRVNPMSVHSWQFHGHYYSGVFYLCVFFFRVGSSSVKLEATGVNESG